MHLDTHDVTFVLHHDMRDSSHVLLVLDRVLSVHRIDVHRTAKTDRRVGNVVIVANRVPKCCDR